MSKRVDTSFRHVISDYFRASSRREIAFDFGPAAVLTAVVSIRAAAVRIAPSELKDFLSYTIALLAILVGFTLTCLVILVTTNSQNVEDLKDRDTGMLLRSRTVSLFQVLLVTMSYVIVIELILIVADILAIALASASLVHRINSVILLMNVFVALHAVFVNIRNTASLYLTLYPASKK